MAAKKQMAKNAGQVAILGLNGRASFAADSLRGKEDAVDFVVLTQPKHFARPAFAQHRLGKLINLHYSTEYVPADRDRHIQHSSSST